jgi:uncharacterized protein (TIGR03086 family)
MTSDNDLAVLRGALDQLADLLSEVAPDALNKPTPCEQWTVRELVDHIVAAPARFAAMMRGQSVDWSAATPAANSDPVVAFRSHADDLLQAWRSDGAASGGSLDWQCAELAVHTWDLATALGRSSAEFDAEAAERGYAFMQANLTSDNRGAAFAGARTAPEGSDAYQRIAAFAGRSV